MLPKLFQWLLVGGTFVAIWIGLLLGYIDSDINDSTKDIILFMQGCCLQPESLLETRILITLINKYDLPVFVIVAFAMYSVVVIAYRVATFNDCLQDSIDLKQDIEDAKKDLKSKGFKFD